MRLADRYISDRCLPDKAIDLIDEAAAELKMEATSKPALVEQALANTSIDKLKKLEEQVGGFAEKPEGCERFFRSGRTGEGAEQLSIEQRRRLAKGLAEVMQRFGYEGVELG